MPVFGLGMSPRGPSTRPRRAHERHQVGSGDGDVEIEHPPLDRLEQVLGADDVGTGISGLGRLLTCGEHRHPHVAAGAGRQADRAPHDLVGLAGVDPEAERHLDGLVEMGLGQVLGDVDRLAWGVEVGPVVPLGRILVALAFRHLGSLVIGCRPGEVLPVSALLVRVVTGGAVRRRARPAFDLEAHRPGRSPICSLAASRSLALRSAILILAISVTWSSVTVPAGSWPDRVDPFSTPAAWRSSTGVGGVLVTKEKVRSWKIVTSTGMIVPAWASVAALYCFTKSMIAMPWGPSAVPTGGAGVAFPAGIWILTTAATCFLAIGLYLLVPRRRLRSCPGSGRVPVGWGPTRPRPRRSAQRSAASQPGDLAELQLDGVSRPKMLTRTLTLSWSSLMSTISPEKSAKGPSLTRTVSPELVLEAGLAPLGRLVAGLAHRQERLDVASGQRGGLVALADEPGDTGCVADHVPRVVIELAAHEQVAGEHLAGDDDLAAPLNSTTSSTGMTTSWMRPSMFIEPMRASRFWRTLFS